MIRRGAGVKPGVFWMMNGPSGFGLTALSQVRWTDRLSFRASRILLRATATKTTSTMKIAVVRRAAGSMIAKLMIEVKRDRPSRSVPCIRKWRHRRKRAKKVTTKEIKARTQAIGWRIRTVANAFETMLVRSSS